MKPTQLLPLLPVFVLRSTKHVLDYLCEDSGKDTRGFTKMLDCSFTQNTNIGDNMAADTKGRNVDSLSNQLFRCWCSAPAAMATAGWSSIAALT